LSHIQKEYIQKRNEKYKPEGNKHEPNGLISKP